MIALFSKKSGSLELYFSTDEMQLLKELEPTLENTGFVFDVLEKDKLIISGLPIAVTESETSILIDQLLSDVEDGLATDSFSLNDKIAKSMAKSLAIKTGTYLSETEQETLINALFGCKDSVISPFYKPTFININVEELDKKFAI